MTDDLTPARPWTWDALAGAGAIVSDAHDMLALRGRRARRLARWRAPARHAMKLSQEPQLEHDGDNEGLGLDDRSERALLAQRRDGRFTTASSASTRSRAARS